MKNFKLKNLGWGLFFIIAAVLIILNATGMLLGLGMWSLILGLLLVPVFITSICHASFTGIFFPVAFWAILYAEPLGIEKFTPWPVLGAALFLSIGFYFIFPKKYRWYHKHTENLIETDCEEEFDKWDNQNVEGECLKMSTKFSGASRYVNTENFKSCEINCSFGGMKVFFDNAKIQDECAYIKLNTDFSGVDLFIPKEWTVKMKVDCKMGGIEEKGIRDAEKNGKILYLTGNTSFSGVTIRYV